MHKMRIRLSAVQRQILGPIANARGLTTPALVRQLSTTFLQQVAARDPATLAWLQARAKE